MMLRRTLLALSLAAAAGVAAAQAAYPTKPITMIVPFPPGGVADTVARPVAEAMSRDLGQPVVIENRAGAGGGIGMGLVAKAPADGSTILHALSSFSVIPEADVVPGPQQVDPFSALRALPRFTPGPTGLPVRADAPWKTAKDFIEDARAHPGTI